MSINHNTLLYIAAASATIAALAAIATTNFFQDNDSKAIGENMSVKAHASEQEAEGHKHTNRLINETSPYLLQHAHNPVNWYAWGPDAFEAAREQNKPIFLSIGYSTCYWCHVMERESFETEVVATVLNEHFIAIKVDREERPDVDDIYMAAVQAITGRGGWPMSVFLEPENLKPFYGGTYFPQKDFIDLLGKVNEVWITRRDDIVGDANRLADAIAIQLKSTASPMPIGEQQLQIAQDTLMRIYDKVNAGFGDGGPRSNKFPMPVYLELLMAVGWDNPSAKNAITHTLDRMAMGGMYDQIGGGFHRYSTDPKWLVPHFEKMTYDNGQLASVYAEAYSRTNDSYYAEIVRETLDYVLREMTDSQGGFFSAQDAEVNAREGQNYIWLESEVREALTNAGMKDDIDFTLKVYGIEAGTNFTDPHHPEDGSKNVVHLINRPDEIAKNLGLELNGFNERLEAINKALLKVRDQRDQPGTDDKILSGWNGLMIAGLADGGRVLNAAKYISAARRASDFVLKTMRSEDGGLLRTYRDGQAKIDAVFEDYAFVVKGLISLHRATDEQRFVDQATEIAEIARERFWDYRLGGYFDTLSDQSDLFVRSKSTYDGAVPCGNSVMALNLLDLYELTNDEKYLDDAVALLRGISSQLSQNPVSSALATVALKRLLDKYPQRLLALATVTPAVPDVVKIIVDAREVNVSEETPGEFLVKFEISDDYHINAHNPGQEFLVGLQIHLVSARGYVLEAKYPQGELFQDEIRIYEGSVTVPVKVTKTGPIEGEPEIVVTYQVCTDRLCLAPSTKTLEIKILETSPGQKNH
ncbi:MAG: DUF255 domain-containing protein [Planctomycetes bacterium]|nr:DUF255 domain-containing protein [Planctomycetota bacterium]